MWTPWRRRQRLAGMEREADRLIDLMGEEASATARRMEREANDFSTMRYWIAIQAIIARKAGRSVDIDPAGEVVAFGRPHGGSLAIGPDVPFVASLGGGPGFPTDAGDAATGAERRSTP